jgi:hypothetical protein
MPSKISSPRGLGYQQISGLSIAKGLTLPAGVQYAMITPLTQAVRWRDDGTDPTSLIGYPLSAGAELRYDAASLSLVRFIEQAPSAILNVAYYGG